MADTTIKQYAISLLLLRGVSVDSDNRSTGYSYLQILSKIRRRFPVITYKGPHKGKPIKMVVGDLRKIASRINQDDPAVRLPLRPRHSDVLAAKRKKKA